MPAGGGPRLVFARLLSGLGRIVWARCGPYDKYGRVLATLYLNEQLDTEWDGNACGANGTTLYEDINAEMLRLGHGVPYEGGTKAAAPLPASRSQTPTAGATGDN